MTRQQRLTDLLILFGAAVLSLGWFFRFDLMTGFNLTFSDRFDGTIEVALLEHWFRVFTAHEHWSQPLYFYPVRQTLGYNDGYFLFGLIYSPFRALGADPYLSSECVNIVVKTIGFAGFAAFALYALRLPTWAAAAGAASFTVANNSYMQAAHNQLLTVAFAPVLAVLGAAALKALHDQRRSAGLAYTVLAAALFDAWLMTSFYLAWFFALFAALCLPLVAFFSAVHLRALWAGIVTCRTSLAAATVVLLTGLIPFARTYLSKARESGMHSLSEVSGYLLGPLDALYLGGDNLLWGWSQNLLSPYFNPSGEHATGFTPILLALAAFGLLAGTRQLTQSVARVAIAMGLASIGCWLVALSISGHSLWPWLYDYIPGAGAIRVVSRIQLALQWPLTCLAAIGLAAIARSRHSAMAWLSAPLAVLIIVEQFNSFPIPAWERGPAMVWLQSMLRPPENCRAFVLLQPRPQDLRFGQYVADIASYNIDPMIVAEWWGLPTLNGFASVQPSSWNLLYTTRADYLAQGQDWARRNAIQDLCGLDLNLNRWTVAPFGS